MKDIIDLGFRDEGEAAEYIIELQKINAELLEALEEVTKELHEMCRDEQDDPSVGIEGWDDINGRIIPNALAVIKKAKS